jgi:capsular exopolysaccharide synthesis family protein
MGKVFDALQRAEEQRARRANEGAVAGVPGRAEPTADLGSPRPKTSTLPRRFWQRWMLRRSRSAVEDAGALNKRRIALLQPQSHIAEQFRTLRARLDSLATHQPMRSLVVTSANPGDGKTMSAINLALVMSMSVGRKVVLMDCDLRSPRVQESLGLRVEAGLTEVLRGAAEIDDALVSVEGSALQVIPVRSLPANPAELLASGRMREVIEKLAARFDCVILDTPPTLGLPDAKIVSDLCDGILFVVRAHATPQEDVEASFEVLDRARILGVVLNEADTSPGRYGDAG